MSIRLVMPLACALQLLAGTAYAFPWHLYTVPVTSKPIRTGEFTFRYTIWTDFDKSVTSKCSLLRDNLISCEPSVLTYYADYIYWGGTYRVIKSGSFEYKVKGTCDTERCYIEFNPMNIGTRTSYTLGDNGWEFNGTSPISELWGWTLIYQRDVVVGSSNGLTVTMEKSYDDDCELKIHFP